MERCITWYWIFCKLQLKKVSTWFLMALMLLVLVITNKTSIPTSKNNTICLLNQSGEMGEKLVQQLLSMKSAFEFQLAENESTLKKMVRKGQVDCAFIIEPEFDAELQLGNQKGLITCVQSIYTKKANVACETIYSVVFPMISEVLLAQKQNEVFGTTDKVMLQELLNENEKIQASDEVFHISVETMSGSFGKEESRVSLWDNGGSEGIVGLFIFMSILFARGETLKTSQSAVWQSRDQAEQRRYLFTYCLSTAVIPLVAGVGYLAFTKGRLVQYCLVFALYAIICCVWSCVFGMIFRREETYASWMLSILLANLVLCPIFVNLAAVIPAVGVINQIFPVGILIKVLRWMAL